MRRPLRPCSYPGCGVLGEETRCEKHRQQERQEADARRGSAASRGYDSRWTKARATFLRSNPLCAECGRSGRVMAAIVVDHIQPHRGDQILFWDRNNWQPLCKTCHDSIKQREERRGEGA